MYADFELHPQLSRVVLEKEFSNSIFQIQNPEVPNEQSQGGAQSMNNTEDFEASYSEERRTLEDQLTSNYQQENFEIEEVALSVNSQGLSSKFEGENTNKKSSLIPERQSIGTRGLMASGSSPPRKLQLFHELMPQAEEPFKPMLPSSEPLKNLLVRKDVSSTLETLLSQSTFDPHQPLNLVQGQTASSQPSDASSAAGAHGNSPRRRKVAQRLDQRRQSKPS
jgi:hypothetical protein